MVAVNGIDIIWLFRVLDNAGTEAAYRIAFQTEGELTETRDSDSVPTKDGILRVPGQLEVEGSFTAIFSRDDPNEKKLRDALRDGKKVEFWEIDSANEGTSTDAGKFEATYYQGYLTERSKSFNAEDHAEISYSYSMEGKGQDGYATLTAEQAEVVQYVFKDTTASV